MTAPPPASDVAAMLGRRADALCQALLSAGRRNGGYWTVGGVDNLPGKSMWVHLTGPRAGNWQDAGTGEFGDAMDLIAACLYRGDLKAAYRWALDFLGIGSGGSAATVRPEPAAPARPAASDDDRQKAAHRMWLEAEASIANTPVDAYLKGRGIDLAELGRQPRALRFHRDLYHRPSRMRFPAMVAAISGQDGTHLATHRTWLERVGGAWVKARVEPNKMSFGTFAGGSIRLWRGASKKPLKDALPDEPVCIGEGIETCLSVAIACPELRVLCAVSQGNFGGIWLPDQVRMVILCAENDDKPAARMAFQRVVDRHLDAGRHVRIARSAVGKDFNDVLRGWA